MYAVDLAWRCGFDWNQRSGGSQQGNRGCRALDVIDIQIQRADLFRPNAASDAIRAVGSMHYR